MDLATIGAVVALVVSIISAIASFVSTLSDRRKGIKDQQMSEARYGLDTIKTVIDVKDTIIEQLTEENKRLRELLNQK